MYYYSFQFVLYYWIIVVTTTITFINPIIDCIGFIQYTTTSSLRSFANPMLRSSKIPFKRITTTWTISRIQKSYLDSKTSGNNDQDSDTTTNIPSILKSSRINNKNNINLSNIIPPFNNNTENNMSIKNKNEDNIPTIIIEYSINFRRHVVKEQRINDGTWNIIESFLWLDEAIQKYPNGYISYNQIDQYINLNNPNSHNNNYNNTTFFMIAGDAFHKNTAYYYNHYLNDISNIDNFIYFNNNNNNNNITNFIEINTNNVRNLLYDLLKLFPIQIDQLFIKCPSLCTYPYEILKERLLFFMAPLPNEIILQQVNLTDDIDWPKLFYPNDNSGVETIRYGAGMSLSQVSHALQALPDLFILRYNAFDIMDPNSHSTKQQSLITLYEQTPPVVLQMTHTVLDLWLTGASGYEPVALAYLHWIGWDWTQCRIMLHAFPCILQCQLEPCWELYNNERSSSTKKSSSHVRKQLITDALLYLQMRLHLRPWHIHSMLRTHPRLSGYHISMIKQKMDYIQDKLGFTSKDLRSIILIMPSILGTSLESLHSRVLFYQNDIGLNVEQLRKVILQHPSLLQYSVEDNLRVKLNFYSNVLFINATTDLIHITKRNPKIWGRSFEQYIVPFTNEFCQYFHNNIMTYNDFGYMIIKVPELYHYNWNGNIYNKLHFLEENLKLNKHQLKMFIQTSPRILLQSISTSLKPKMELLQQVAATVPDLEQYLSIQKNPSLLLYSLSYLKKRIDRYNDQIISNEISNFNDDMGLLSSQMRKSFSRHRAVELIQQEVVEKKKSNNLEVEEIRHFDSVALAASHAGISTSSMYKALQQGRIVNGKQYRYLDTSINTLTVPTVLDATEKEFSLLRTKSILQNNNIKARYALEQQQQQSDDISFLTIEIAGGAFPPEDTVRGRRRAGGMALCIKGWSANDWKQVCYDLWTGWRVRIINDGNTVILGYRYIRPSRPRCTLYACREAIRVATEWCNKRIINNNNTSTTIKKVHITIITESNYVIELLQNTTQLSILGNCKTKDDIEIYTKNGLQLPSTKRYTINPDILHPLAISYNQLVNKQNINSNIHQRKEVIVKFRQPQAELDDNDDGINSIRRNRDSAQLAAKLMHDSIRKT